MVELNFTFVVFTLSFIIFLVIMKLGFFDPVKKIIDQRESTIEANLTASKKAAEQIQQELSNAGSQGILAKARQEAQTTLSSAISAASKEKQKLVNDSLLTINKQIEENQQALEQEHGALAGSLDNYVQEVSRAAINKIFAELETKKAATV